MAKNTEKNSTLQHGGARKGAGRPRLHGTAITKTVAASVPEPLINGLDRWAKTQGLTRSQAVTEAIRRLVG